MQRDDSAIVLSIVANLKTPAVKPKYEMLLQFMAMVWMVARRAGKVMENSLMELWQQDEFILAYLIGNLHIGDQPREIDYRSKSTGKY